MNVNDLWDAYRISKQTEQELSDKVDGGKSEHYWLTTVEPPFWFLAELMEAANSTSGFALACMKEE
jgi:hypothetical protein